MSWFMAGGFPMFPVLVVGAMSIVAAFRHAAVPGRGWAVAAGTLRAAAMLLGVAGSCFDLSVVSMYVGHMEDTAAVAQISMVGLGEAMGPVVLAGLLAGLSALTASAGDLRDANPS